MKASGLFGVEVLAGRYATVKGLVRGFWHEQIGLEGSMGFRNLGLKFHSKRLVKLLNALSEPRTFMAVDLAARRAFGILGTRPLGH